MPPFLINFAALTVGTKFKAPAGTEIFKEKDVSVALEELRYATGPTTIGHAEVVASSSGDNELKLGNCCLNLDLSQLAFEPSGAVIHFRNYARFLNLSVNGSISGEYEFSTIPTRIRKVNVETKQLAANSFAIALHGRMETLVFGGAEIFVEGVEVL